MTTESQNFMVIVKMTNKDSKEIFTLWNMVVSNQHGPSAHQCPIYIKLLII